MCAFHALSFLYCLTDISGEETQQITSGNQTQPSQRTLRTCIRNKTHTSLTLLTKNYLTHVLTVDTSQIVCVHLTLD